MKRVCALLMLLVCSIDGYPSGPPAERFTLVCKQLIPSPNAHGPAQSGNGGYLVNIEPEMVTAEGGFVYKPNQAYSITLVGTIHIFKGFLIEARNPSTSTPLLIGQFSGLKDGSKTLNCDPAGVATEAAVGHSNPSIRSSVQFTWTAPPTKGSVDFYYTVVRELQMHYDHLSAAQLGPSINNHSFAGEDFEEVKRRLTQAHGVLMLVAWPLLAVTAVFFPVFMKPVLPGGGWFQAHRALMLASVGIAGMGVVLIFVAQLHQSPPGLILLGSIEPIGTVHFVFGVVVMSLHIINPIIGLFRCKPDSKRRWIFNLLHGRVIGPSVLLLALVNVSLGIYLLDYKTFDAAFWIIVTWDILFLISVVCLFVFYSLITVTSTSKDRVSKAPSTIQFLFKIPTFTEWSHTEMKTFSNTGEQVSLVTETSDKVSKKDHLIRWITLIGFLCLSIPFILAVIIIILI